MTLQQGVVTFHPFSFDTETGCLFMRGHKIHIPEQNARLLNYLIQKSGRLATREELRDFLWQENAPYDSQQAINKAISQLRTALRDNSSTPLYIETIPRRGYRFCAEFHHVPHSNSGLSLATSTEVLPRVSVSLQLPSAGVALDHQVRDPAPAPSNRMGIARGVALVSLTLVLLVSGVFVRRSWKARHAIPAQVIITMGIPPMDAIGKDASAMAESFRLDLSETLAQLPEVKVLSVHAFMSSPQDHNRLTELERSQMADVLLLGRFEVKDGRCVLQFELVRNADSSHLASFHYEGAPEQLRGLLTRIQEDVFTRLNLTSNGARPLKSSTLPDAYRAYIQGRHDLIERTNDALNKSIVHFKYAIDLDPHFAKAYSGLGSAYLVLASHRAFPAGYQMSRELAMHALQLDSSVAEAHALLGCIAMSMDWDARTSEAQLRRAIALDPDEASYHIWLSTTLNNQGRFDESLRQIDLAKQEDPYWPPVYLSEVMAAANAGQKKRVIAASQTLLKLTPSWPIAHNMVASADWSVGFYREAIAEWRTMYSLENDRKGIRLEDDGLRAFLKGGTAAYARVHLQNARQVAGTSEAFDPLAISEWSAYADDRQTLLATIQSMVDHHDPEAISLSVDPAFNAFHNDSSFIHILVQAGLDFDRGLGKRDVH